MERSTSRPPAKKGVVGTSNNSVQTSRKMKSPPADIFVWGVHPNTSIQDIIADLSESGIEINEEAIKKMSKEDAFLVSYKISVNVENLQKALDPSVWPLRVKVREFIHYARRTNRQSRPQVENQKKSQHQSQVGDNREHGELLVTQNRYDLLANDAAAPDV